MKRLAMIAVLAAAAGSLDPSIVRGQTVPGYSKTPPYGAGAYGSPGPANMAAYGQAGMAGGVPPQMMPQGYSPYSPAGYASYQPAMQMSYPGYAPTPENMMYGGSPYPQPMSDDDSAGYGAAPAGYGAAAGDYGSAGAGDCADGSCGSDACGTCGRIGHCRPHHWIFGFDATADWVGSSCSHAYVTVEGLRFFPKGANAPPLLTTSPLGTPQSQAGVIGAPGTQVLVGGSEFDDEAIYGGRFALGFWTMGAEYVGFEFNYMGFDNGGTTINASSSFNPNTGGGILAMPFFNVTTGAEDSLILAFPTFSAIEGILNTGGLPIDVNGSFALDSDLEIHSAGALMKSVVWVLPDAGWRMFFVGGYRFFWLSDDLDITGTIEPVSPLIAAGSRIEVFDSFDTENQFHGGEVGLQTELASGPWSIGILTKVALGNNHQRLEIAGETRSISGGAVAITPGGLFSQPSNIGKFSDDRFAVLPEASVTFGYQIARSIRLTAGYNFLYINRVLRAAEQIDRSINTTQFDAGTLVGEARPARIAVEDEFWMHGFSTGIEIKW